MKAHSYPLILFQGDSITDAARKSKKNETLGEGYAMISSAWLSALYPEYGFRFINRGIGGNRIRDLKKRWRQDCLKLEPSLVSILVGINDALGKPFYKEPTPPDNFESDLKDILRQTRENSDIQIVLMEPFLLLSNENYSKTRSNLKPILEIIRDLSKKFKTNLIHLDNIFARAESLKDPHYWSLDGVHPTLAGHGLIAQSWVREIIVCQNLPN